MKVKILYEFKTGPYGGVNQFLKALKDYFEKSNEYTDDLEEADMILFNSCNNLSQIIAAKQLYPDKIFVQRIDGPARLYNRMSDKRDLVTNTVNRYIADATIFQSDFSRDMNYQMGLCKNQFETTIINATDESIFNSNNKAEFGVSGKVRLIATSWSKNWNKGFDVYQYLDQNLDTNRYEMTFVGNTPVEFRNIVHKPPLDSLHLAEELKKHDIYITASKKDPCSNSLIEALSCGLPAIVLHDGGHPEIVKEAGEMFYDKIKIIELIDKVANDYGSYTQKINVMKMSDVGAHYAEFLKKIEVEYNKGKIPVKKLTSINLYKIRLTELFLKISEKLNSVSQKWWKKE